MEDLVQAYLVVDVEPLHTPEINIVHAEPLVSFFERHQRLFRGLLFVGVTFIFLGAVFALAVILPEIIKEQYRETSLVRIVLEESNISSIKELGCSQALAKNWILGSSNLQLDPKKDRDQIAQRYILATLFYSMGGENSKNRSNFLSPDNKCNWYPEAVACSRHDKVLNISLVRYRLKSRGF